MNDRELDSLFAQAREETPEDAGAADRFLMWHRANEAGVGASAAPALPAPAPHRHRSARWPALLASAAVLAGLLVTRPLLPGTELPTSVAYDAYQGALGEGW